MSNSKKMCVNCYWYENCCGAEICDEFTPMDDSLDEEYYADILKENLEEYQSLVMEQQS